MHQLVLTGASLVAAGVSLNIGKKDGLAMKLLALLMITFALSVFSPMIIAGDQMAIRSFLKDLGLAGAAFFYETCQRP